MEEIWKDIPGWEDLYQVSNLGNFRSKEKVVTRHQRDGRNITRTLKSRPIKTRLNVKLNRVIVGLHRENVVKYFYAHRLVAMAFHPNPNNLPEVNHKNEITTDNRADNLEWCDRIYNVRYGTGRERANKKLHKPCNCYSLDGEFIKRYEGIVVAARALNGDKGNIFRAIKSGGTSYGYRWTYAERKE